ncbi:MAG: Eco47II family restriction endonuclease [Xenococcaceae cyanobacterium]
MTQKYNYLNWIEDDSLYKAIQHVYQAYEEALQTTDLKGMQKNVIDPFLPIFELSFRKDFTFEKWFEQEANRQIQKKINNAIGDFHQKILGSAKGWVDLGKNHETGLDIRNDSCTIFAEIKNKYNTISGSKLDSAFKTLETAATKYPDATFYLVHIIREKKNPYDEIWSFQSKGTQYEHPQIRIISGEKFYEIVAGKNSLANLAEILPKAINDFMEEKNKLKKSEMEAFKDIQEEIGQDFTKEQGFLYLFNQAYKTYNYQKNSEK